MPMSSAAADEVGDTPLPFLENAAMLENPLSLNPLHDTNPCPNLEL